MIIAAVLAGFLLGRGGLDVISLDPTSDFVSTLAVVALILILFRDGLEVEAEMLQTAWRPPLRKLVVAMPVTAVLVALAAHVLTDLGWTECFLIGALLSPTDPVLSSSVVTNPRVPRVIRHSLNLESGLNDGLALPAVLAFANSLDANEHGFVWWKFVLQDVSIGLVTGLVVGYLASRLRPRGGSFQALFALAVGFLAYGVAVLPPHGNGLIAVFVCAIVLGVRRPEMRVWFEGRWDGLLALVKLGVFLVFGSLLTLSALFGDGLAAVALVAFLLLVARPAAVFLALAGTRIDVATRAFMSWFGPKGVATMTFALLVLASDGIASRERIFNIAALAVLVSIILHGITDAAGAEWIAARAEREERRGDLEHHIDGRRAQQAGGPAERS
ncbi:MAG: sodium/hydrogen antiporter [Thermoleophilaceae bacterium]|nr:sodium/hydrogen antiporter [Thermoleophilaceae bacterium]